MSAYCAATGKEKMTTEALKKIKRNIVETILIPTVFIYLITKLNSVHRKQMRKIKHLLFVKGVIKKYFQGLEYRDHRLNNTVYLIYDRDI